MTRVLVTGAGGFIGRAVLARLGRTPMALTALLGPDDAPVPGPWTTLQGDIRDPSVVADALLGASAVIHLAGPASVADSFDAPERFASVHVEGGQTLFAAAREARIGRFILISSAEIYGQGGPGRVTEAQAAAPLSPYGAAKLAAERRARAALAPDALTIIRPFSVYGPGMRRTSLPGRLLDQATGSRDIQIESLRRVRDYLHVDDLAELIVLALARPPRAAPRVLNACSGRGVSVRRLAALTMRAAGRRAALVERPPARPRPAEVLRLVGDPGAALALGWPGPRPLRRGLADVARQWAPMEAS